jgi:hypothetical protein
MVEMQKKMGLLQDRLNSELCHMSTDCSFFGGSSGNPSCANWWITVPKLLEASLSVFGPNWSNTSPLPDENLPKTTNYACWKMLQNTFRIN